MAFLKVNYICCCKMFWDGIIGFFWMEFPSAQYILQHCINNKLPNIKMDEITITYRLKYRFKSHNHICKSVCNRYFNTQKGIEIFIKKNGGSKGIWLDRRTFIIESKIAENLEVIPKYKFIPNDYLTNL